MSPSPFARKASRPFSEAAFAMYILHSVASMAPFELRSMKKNMSFVSLSGISAAERSEFLSASSFAIISSNGGTFTCAPGSFCGVLKPETKTVSPMSTGPDFISPGSALTNQTVFPSRGE